MDIENFATHFDIVKHRLVDRIRAQLLDGEDENKYIKAELYKLNVYGMFMSPIYFFVYFSYEVL
jgi:hypothetical protein